MSDRVFFGNERLRRSAVAVGNYHCDKHGFFKAQELSLLLYASRRMRVCTKCVDEDCETTIAVAVDKKDESGNTG